MNAIYYIVLIDTIGVTDNVKKTTYFNKLDMFYAVNILLTLLLTLFASLNNCEDDVIVIASNAVEDFGILESLTNVTKDQQTPEENEIQEASVSRVLNIILRRGKELIKILPRLGIVVAKRLLDHVPSPEQVLNFAKQVLIGLPQEVIAFAIDVVCEFI